MTTTVVNIYKDPYDVYIGRAGKGQDGYYGNPVTINKTCPICGGIHKDRGSTLPCYEIYFKKRIESDSEFKERILSLEGKRLGCFCRSPNDPPTKICHGLIIAEWIKQYKFMEHLKKSREIVRSWPEWKREILRNPKDIIWE